MFLQQKLASFLLAFFAASPSSSLQLPPTPLPLPSHSPPTPLPLPSLPSLLYLARCVAYVVLLPKMSPDSLLPLELFSAASHFVAAPVSASASGSASASASGSAWPCLLISPSPSLLLGVCICSRNSLIKYLNCNCFRTFHDTDPAHAATRSERHRERERRREGGRSGEEHTR